MAISKLWRWLRDQACNQRARAAWPWGRLAWPFENCGLKAVCRMVPAFQRLARLRGINCRPTRSCVDAASLARLPARIPSVAGGGGYTISARTLHEPGECFGLATGDRARHQLGCESDFGSALRFFAVSAVMAARRGNDAALPTAGSRRSRSSCSCCWSAS